MKHITERRGTLSNVLECTPEEFIALGNFLRAIGVEIRPIIYSNESVELQARNPHRDWCITASHLTGSEIKKRADEDIASGRWRR